MDYADGDAATLGIYFCLLKYCVLYGVGKISPESLSEAMQRTWGWIKQNKFYIDIEKVPLADIEKAWKRNDLAGTRIVIVP
jgi:hypothetical protein